MIQSEQMTGSTGTVTLPMPKALEDVDAVDENGDPLWVQELDETLTHLQW
jgi:hypothetical protein